jgi:hypothetical protein
LVKPIIVTAIVTALLFLGVALLHDPLTDEQMCAGEGGILRQGTCHPVE